jgi:hypothetical protein
MRKWLDLFENENDPSAIVLRVRDLWVEETGQTPRQINRGSCFEFAEALEAEAPHLFESIEIGNIFRYTSKYSGEPVGYDEELLQKHWPKWKPFPNLTWEDMFTIAGLNWQGTHGWAYCAKTDKCYDVETPEGVENPFNLSFFDSYKEYAIKKTAEKLVVEDFAGSFKTRYAPEGCEVFRNPTRREFQACGGEIRAFLVGDDVLMWNAYKALHQQVREGMNLPKDALSIEIWSEGYGGDLLANVTDNSERTVWHHNPETANYIRNHPALNRMFADISVDYYDGAIVGDWEELEEEIVESALADGEGDPSTCEQPEEFLEQLESLTEAYLNTYNVECDYGAVEKNVEVFKNPSRREITKLMADSEYASLRASLYPDDDILLVWEGSRVQHHDLDHAVFGSGSRYYVRLFIDRTGVSMNYNEEATDEMVAATKASPAMQHLCGKNFEIEVI